MLSKTFHLYGHDNGPFKGLTMACGAISDANEGKLAPYVDRLTVFRALAPNERCEGCVAVSKGRP